MGKLDSIEFLKIRILVSLLKMSPENCNVTNLSKTLGLEKYTVSRVFTALEKDGYLNRTDSRHPRLEKLGEQTARKYAERMDIATNHLIYEGVTEAQACNDALYLSMYCSDETFEVIRSMEEQYRMKHLLRTYERFDGTILCNGLRDGQYLLPFIIYRERQQHFHVQRRLYTSLYAVGHGRQGHDFVKGTAGREIFRDDGKKNERKD